MITRALLEIEPVLREIMVLILITIGDTLRILVNFNGYNTRARTMPFQLLWDDSRSITISVDEPVTVAAKLMRDRTIGSLIVVHEGQVRGIVTERDLVHRVLASMRNPNTVFITNVMTTPVVTISQREDMASVAKLMQEKGIRRLVVMNKQELVGALTTDDLTRNLMQVTEEFAVILFIIERRTNYDREMIHRVTR